MKRLLALGVIIFQSGDLCSLHDRQGAPERGDEGESWRWGRILKKKSINIIILIILVQCTLLKYYVVRPKKKIAAGSFWVKKDT